MTSGTKVEKEKLKLNYISLIFPFDIDKELDKDILALIDN